jgi:hypothetical protein
MAHFAEIDENNLVVRVLVVDNSLELNGADFLANELNLGGTWIQTSYNNNIRGVFAGIGFSYNEIEDIFVTPQPFPSWTREGSFWNAPIEQPNDGNKYVWNEENLNWDLINETLPE